MNRPTIAIIGPGRAGSALARALRTAGYVIAAVNGRNPDNARQLATELNAKTTATAAGALDLADLTILAVPDEVIAPLAREIAQSLCASDGKSAVHLSGAQDRAPLATLKAAGVRTGVFHPLQTFRKDPDAVKNIPGSVIGIDADSPLHDLLTRAASDIGGEPFDLSGVDRVRYHAAAVLVANYTVTLLAEAEALAQSAGLDRERAHDGLLRLLSGTVNNLRATTPKEALTGPAARGDDGTVQRHLDALADDRPLQQIYALLAQRSRRLKEAI
jgi:predicted short-subunit dehydrogenase-like oxidoreductase (DUF2520 family)